MSKHLSGLVIDTAYFSSWQLGVFINDGEEFFTFSSRKKETSITNFWSSLDYLLRSAGINKAEIDLIGINIGPGPFTGIRNGVSIAKTVCQILKVPIVSFSTKEIFEYLFPADKFILILDARASKFIVMDLERQENEIIRLEGLQNFVYKSGKTPVFIGCDKVQIQNSISIDILPFYTVLKYVLMSYKQGRYTTNPNEINVLYHEMIR